MIDPEGQALEAWKIEAATQKMFADRERKRRERVEAELERLRLKFGLLLLFVVLYTTLILAGLSWLFANFTPA